MKYLLGSLAFLATSAFSAGLPPERLAKYDQQHLCRLIAKYYFKGHQEYYKIVTTEAKDRGYGRDCAEIAELQMMRIKRTMVPSFRDTLKEVFEPCIENKASL